MDRGHVHVVQPDIGRVGGLTEARRVCDLAGDRGLQIVPHLWMTGISIGAAVHLAAVTPHCAYVEFMPSDLTASGLRRDLAEDGLAMVDGKIALPMRPGLGIKVNRDALEYYEAAARKAYQA